MLPRPTRGGATPTRREREAELYANLHAPGNVYDSATLDIGLGTGQLISDTAFVGIRMGWAVLAGRALCCCLQFVSFSLSITYHCIASRTLTTFMTASNILNTTSCVPILG